MAESYHPCKIALIHSMKRPVSRKVIETTNFRGNVPVNPFNLQFCGYTMLNTCAPEKSRILLTMVGSEAC